MGPARLDCPFFITRLFAPPALRLHGKWQTFAQHYASYVLQIILKLTDLLVFDHAQQVSN